MNKKLYGLMAILLIGMPVVLPSLSQAFLQGIHAEEKEFEMYEEESEVNGLKNENLGETNLTEEGELESPILELGEVNVETQIKDEYSVELKSEIALANVAIITNEVDGSGVSLQIPGGVGVGIYEATLIWNLVATPSVANEHSADK